MIHIVTPFPSLLMYSFFAPTLLRIMLGVISISLGISQKKSQVVSDNETSTTSTSFNKITKTIIGAVFIITGFMSIVGFFTQVAVLVLIILFVVALFKQEWIFQKEVSRSEIILVLIIALSLLISGAGAFAIDYPL